MSTDLDLEERLARIGDQLDHLAREAGADTFEPSYVVRHRREASGARRLVLVAAVVLVVAAVIGGVAVLRGAPDTVDTTDQPGERVNPPDPSGGADLLSARPVLGQAVAATCETGWVPSSFGVCFRLGPAGFTADDVASARAVDQGGTWAVELTLAPESRDDANQMFDECAAAGPGCHGLVGGSGRGMVAFVVEGRVVSAPTIQAPGLADGELLLVLDGPGAGPGLARVEAERLATALD